MKKEDIEKAAEEYEDSLTYSSVNNTSVNFYRKIKS